MIFVAMGTVYDNSDVMHSFLGLLILSTIVHDWKKKTEDVSEALLTLFRSSDGSRASAALAL